MKTVYVVLLEKENFIMDTAVLDSYDGAFNFAKKWAHIELNYLTAEEMEHQLETCHIDGVIWGKNGDSVQVRKSFLWN